MSDVETSTLSSWLFAFAVATLKGGMNVRTLQKARRHAKLETTGIYLDLAEEDVKEV